MRLNRRSQAWGAALETSPVTESAPSHACDVYAQNDTAAAAAARPAAASGMVAMRQGFKHLAGTLNTDLPLGSLWLCPYR